MAFSGQPQESALKSFKLSVTGFAIVHPEAGFRINSNRALRIEWRDSDVAHTSWDVSYSTDGIAFTLIANVSEKYYHWTPPAYLRDESVTIRVEAV